MRRRPVAAAVVRSSSCDSCPAGCSLHSARPWWASTSCKTAECWGRMSHRQREARWRRRGELAARRNLPAPWTPPPFNPISRWPVLRSQHCPQSPQRSALTAEWPRQRRRVRCTSQTKSQARGWSEGPARVPQPGLGLQAPAPAPGAAATATAAAPRHRRHRRCSPPPPLPPRAAGMPGIHIDIKHDLPSGGDPTFSGAFHGAGSGGGERTPARRAHSAAVLRPSLTAAVLACYCHLRFFCSRAGGRAQEGAEERA